MYTDCNLPSAPVNVLQVLHINSEDLSLQRGVNKGKSPSGPLYYEDRERWKNVD